MHKASRRSGEKNRNIATYSAGVAQLVELQIVDLAVVGSIPIARPPATPTVNTGGVCCLRLAV